MKFNCPHCAGTGRTTLKELSIPRQKCLKALARIGPATHDEIFTALPRNGNGITSVFQMMKRMEAAGLVRRLDSHEPARFVVNGR